MPTYYTRKDLAFPRNGHPLRAFFSILPLAHIPSAARDPESLSSKNYFFSLFFYNTISMEEARSEKQRLKRQLFQALM